MADYNIQIEESNTLCLSQLRQYYLEGNSSISTSNCILEFSQISVNTLFCYIITMIQVYLMISNSTKNSARGAVTEGSGSGCFGGGGIDNGHIHERYVSHHFLSGIYILQFIVTVFGVLEVVCLWTKTKIFLTVSFVDSALFLVSALASAAYFVSVERRHLRYAMPLFIHYGANACIQCLRLAELKDFRYSRTWFAFFLSLFNSLFLILSLVGAAQRIYVRLVTNISGNVYSKRPVIPESRVYLYNEACSFSRLSFWWLNPVLVQGYRAPLEIEDLQKLPAEERTKIHFLKLKCLLGDSGIENKKSIFWGCLKMNWSFVLLGGLFRLLADILGYGCALSINVIVNSITSEVSRNTSAPLNVTIIDEHFYDSFSVSELFYDPRIVSVVIFMSSLGQGALSQTSNHLLTVSGIRAKNALHVLLYQKSLKLPVGSWSPMMRIHRKIRLRNRSEGGCLSSTDSIDDDYNNEGNIDIGFITNLASEDIINVRELLWNVHYAWALPLKIIVLLGLLYDQLGISGVTGAVLGTALILPLQVLTGKLMSENNKRVLSSQDARLFKSTEALASMKTVKLGTMEEWALNRIRAARSKELVYLKRDSFLWSVMAFLASISTTLVTTLTLGLFVVLEDHNFNAADLFTSMALLSQLTVCLSVVPVSVPIFIKGIVSLQRLGKFFDRSEVSLYRQTDKMNAKRGMYDEDEEDDDDEDEDEDEEEEDENYSERRSSKKLPEIAFMVENGTFAWPKSATNVLQSINLEIKTGSLTIVIGPSGSGKTALISSLIEEMDRITGKVKWNVPDSVALLGQRPWLLNATIKDNILLGRPFKEKRYKKVIDACDLQTDIDLLPHGDETEIGERGVLLSGGQRQRLAIARCLYSKAYCTFMDAPFSSLDSKITNHVFEEGVLKILRKRRRTVFLTTERLDFLHRADHIVAIKDGRIRAQGTVQDVTRLCPEILGAKLGKKPWKSDTDDNKGLVEGRTAQERWKLLRNVTKLGIKVSSKVGKKNPPQTDDNYIGDNMGSCMLLRRHRSHSGGASSSSSVQSNGGSLLLGKSLSQLPSSSSASKIFRSHVRIESSSQSNLTHDILLPSDEYLEYSFTEEEGLHLNRHRRNAMKNSGSRLFSRTLSWNMNSKESTSTSSSMSRSIVRRSKTPPNRSSNHAGEFQRMRSFNLNNNRLSNGSNKNGGRSSSHRDSIILSSFFPKHSNSEPDGFLSDTIAPLKRRSIVLEPPHSRVSRLTSNSSQISSISGFSDDFHEEDEDEEGLLYLSPNGQPHERREYGSIDIGVLLQYFRAGGPHLALLYVILSFTLQSVKVYMDFLLRDWSMEKKTGNMTSYFTFYGSLSVIVVIISCLANLTGQLIGARARSKFHEDMIKNVIFCPLELFEAHPIGRIINRISHDIFILDQKLPSCIQRMIMVSFVCTAALSVNSIQSPIFLIFAIPMILVYWWLQHFYRRTSRELQRIDSITRAPVLSHFSDTLSGLITVRAFGEENRFINELCEKVDTNTSAFLVLQSGCRWLGVYLDVSGAVFIFISVLVNIFFPRKGTSSSASVGLSVNYSLLVPIYLAWVVKFAADIENYMNAVERVLEYTDFPSEEEVDFEDEFRGRKQLEEDTRVSGDFLENISEGLIIRFNSVCLASSFEVNRRLHCIQQGFSLEIPYKQKVGICGRSGSGKSTLLMGMVRLTRVLQGSITINGVNINNIPLTSLRKFVHTIPQDAVLFSGTVRSNLDPDDSFADEEIWETLDKADCGKMVRNFPEGLDTTVTENGDNFSLGERQELNIAKALLRRPRVVILDESTSALDPTREVALHHILLEAFEDSTLISVAHRLSNLVEYERVLVMGEGRILEDGNPKELLKKPMGFFSALWRAAGEKPLS